MLGGTNNKVTDGVGNNLANRDINQQTTHNYYITVIDPATRGQAIQQEMSSHELQLKLLNDAFAAASDEEKPNYLPLIANLQKTISEKQKRLDDPEAEFQRYEREMKALKQALENTKSLVGVNRLSDAKAAIDVGDMAKAESILLEVGAKSQELAADAAYGLGLIAAEDVRWEEAANHFAKAARLKPSYGNIIAASEFLWRVDRIEEAIEHGEELLNLSRAEYGSMNENTAKALNNLAAFYNSFGQNETALSYIVEATEIRKSIFTENDSRYITSLHNYGVFLQGMGRFEAAKCILEKTVELDISISNLTFDDRVNHTVSLANLFLEIREFGQANILFQQVDQFVSEHKARNHPLFLHHLENYARLLEHVGQYHQAIDVYQEAVKILRGFPQAANVRLPNLLLKYVPLLKKIGRVDLATDFIVECISFYERNGRQVSIEMAHALVLRGAVLLRIGRYFEAEESLTAALRTVDAVGGANSYTHGLALKTLAEICHKSNRNSEAEEYFRASLTVWRNFVQKNNSGMIETLWGLSDILRESRRLFESNLVALEAKNKVVHTFGRESGEFANSLNIIGLIRFSEMRYPDAAEMFQQAIDVFSRIPDARPEDIAIIRNSLADAQSRIALKS